MHKMFSSIILFIISVLIFILAMGLLKEGARPLAPVFRDSFSINSPASALGLGWLAASMMLSGSPVAATSLSLFEARVLDINETFAMISGSRLGAAFIVLFIGFIYILRGKKREISLDVGLTSLLVTQTIYPAVLFLGFFILKWQQLNLDPIKLASSSKSLIDTFIHPIVELIGTSLPQWILFLIGFILITASLILFDKAIPELDINKTNLDTVSHMLALPVVTFLLGMGITSLTMSVSVSLSLLVPLSVRGYVRRGNVIPYILGANITTFIDTLLAAALLNNPAAVRVVLVQMISVSIVSVVILLTSYRFYVRTIEFLVTQVSKSSLRIAVYLALILGLPFLLIWLA